SLLFKKLATWLVRSSSQSNSEDTAEMTREALLIRCAISCLSSNARTRSLRFSWSALFAFKWAYWVSGSNIFMALAIFKLLLLIFLVIRLSIFRRCKGSGISLAEYV